MDLPAFGRSARLVWRKQRWRCSAYGSCFTDHDPEIASPRCGLTTRAARWATLQVGGHGRSVSEVAKDLGGDWHTVTDAVVVFGEPLVDHPDRIGDVSAIGLDETLFARMGVFRTQWWSTQIVDVRRGQLLDVVEGRTAEGPCRWLAAQPQPWRDQIAWATLDLSASYRTVSDTMLPDAVQVADPFHVVARPDLALQARVHGPPGSGEARLCLSDHWSSTSSMSSQVRGRCGCRCRRFVRGGARSGWWGRRRCD